jgi:hypothetical protein
MNMTNQLWLIPQSKKARNRLANAMNNEPVVLIEQETATDWFVVSNNRHWCRWVKKHGDPDWAGLPICETTNITITEP